MDAHEVYQQFRQQQNVPTPEIIANVIEWGDMKTLEFIALLYGQQGKLISMDAVFSSKRNKERLFMNVEHMFTPNVLKQSCISEELLENVPSVRVRAAAIHSKRRKSEPTTPRREPLSAPSSGMQALSLNKTCVAIRAVDFTDDAMAKFSKPRVRILSDYLCASVSNEWVHACASKVSGDTVSDYKLGNLESDRHHHIVNPDVKSFVKALSFPIPEDKVVTWQFSTGGKCVHIGLLQKALNELCPGRGVYLAVFACAIGIPTRGFMDTVSILKKWRAERFKVFDSISPMAKILFRDTFDIKIIHPDLEANQLLDSYKENSNFFRLPSTDRILDIDRYMCSVFYTYPTSNESSELFQRMENNIQRWIS